MFLLQVRFALSSTPVFSRTDTVTDSERFYNSVLDLLDDIEEREEVNDLLVWWNRFAIIYFRYAFASHPNAVRSFPTVPLHDALLRTALWLG